MGILQLGPFNIKYEWLLLLFAAIATYFVLKKMFTNKRFQKEFIDTTINVTILSFLIYKFSIILFRPELIFENPIALFYFNGGTKGLVLALIIGALYLFWKVRKNKWNMADFVEGVIYTAISFLLSYWLLRTLLILAL